MAAVAAGAVVAAEAGAARSPRSQATDIAAKLQAIATTGYSERIFVKGDAKAPYGVIADVMSRIQEAGYKNIGLVTQQTTDH